MIAPDGSVRVEAVPRTVGHAEIEEPRVVRVRDGAVLVDLTGRSVHLSDASFPRPGIVLLRLVRLHDTRATYHVEVDVEAETFVRDGSPARPLAELAFPGIVPSLAAGVCPECGGRAERSDEVTRCLACGHAWDR